MRPYTVSFGDNFIQKHSLEFYRAFEKAFVNEFNENIEFRDCNECNNGKFTSVSQFNSKI